MHWLVFLLALVLASPVWAVEGGPARPAGDANPSSYSKGSHLVREFFLCDGATGGATKTCADFDLIDIGGGFPDFLVFHAIDFTDCAGATVITVTGKDETGGATSDLTALTDAGTDQFVAYPVPNRIIAADVTVGTGCSNLEVLIKLYIRKSTR